LSRSNINVPSGELGRRQFLARIAALATFPALAQPARRPAFDTDELAHRAFRYFWEQADAGTGLVRDRARLDRRPDEPHHWHVASIAATGFGLTALAIGAERGWVDGGAARQRARATLRFFAHRAQHVHGWYFHFLDLASGSRAWQSELSSIDTALLIAGVLAAGAAFDDDREIAALAQRLYRRLDFQWMLAGDRLLLSHGWTPERGFIPYRWDSYDEATILYLLGIGAAERPLAPASWYAWRRPWIDFAGYRYIAGARPLFIHQYSHAWVDYRHRRERQGEHINYFENSVAATRAHRAFCASLHARFPDYDDEHWGITASEGAHGYMAWGGPPFASDIDGTLVPCAAAGSLMFTPDLCQDDLAAMLRDYGNGLPARNGFRQPIWGAYGFCDAFNPLTGWVSPHVLGIDLGIGLLSAENARSGSVWRWFMSHEAPRQAMARIELLPEAAPHPRV